MIQNIYNLINITEDLVYSDPQAEFARNLSNIVKLMPKPCCCNGGVSMISMSAPASLANYGPGLASYIANKMIYGSNDIPKADLDPY